MDCKKCPIKEECDSWYNNWMKKRPATERRIFCPLIHGSMIGIINTLGAKEAIDILVSEEGKENETQEK